MRGAAGGAVARLAHSERAARVTDFAVEPDGLRAFDPPAGAGNVAQVYLYVKEALAAADADGMARELFGVVAFQGENFPEAFDDVGLEHRTVV